MRTLAHFWQWLGMRLLLGLLKAVCWDEGYQIIMLRKVAPCRVGCSLKLQFLWCWGVTLLLRYGGEVLCRPSCWSEVGLKQCSVLGIVLKFERFSWCCIQFSPSCCCYHAAGRLCGLLNKWKSTGISPASLDSRNSPVWADLHSRARLINLNPTVFDINTLKVSLLLYSGSFLERRKRNACYWEAPGRDLACFMFHLISETLVFININEVQLSRIAVVPWY